MDLEGKPEAPAKEQGEEADVAEPMDGDKPSGEPEIAEDKTPLKCVHGKVTHVLDIGPSDTVGFLKEKVAAITNVPAPNQKLTFRAKTLSDNDVVFLEKFSKLTKKDKLILIGTPLADLAMAVMKPADVKPPSDDPQPKEDPIQTQTKHKKILDKGLPPDAEVGNAMATEPLPEGGLKGIYNNMGNPVRLTFKFDNPAMICINGKERTEKYPTASVHDVTSEKIEGRGGYHIVQLKMGKDDKSVYNLYYVPAQYVEAIKASILGGMGMGLF